MMIYLDDENTGKNTPATLEEVSSGEHTIKLQSRWYQPQTKQVTVEDEQTTTVDFELEPAFANIIVKAQPTTYIFLDGEQKGNGNWQGRLMEGIYTVKADKEKYYSQSEQLEVTAGQNDTVSFKLQGKTGNADIITTPVKAEVYVDGEKQGTTPLTLNDLLTGEYNLKIKKEGYGTVAETLVIQEEEAVTVEEQLPDAKKVTISSKISGADVYIEGNHVGKTPYEGELGFGRRKIKVINGEKTKERNINITEGGKNTLEFEVLKMQGTFTDKRDGKIYKWVRIGDQVWMAENLNYELRWDDKGNDWCYDNDQSNCDTYGRLYDWDAVMQGENSSNRNPSGVQGVCPDGWHVPSDKEWEELAKYISKDNDGYTKDDDDWNHVGHLLKSNQGWDEGGNGIDEYEFSAIPVGSRSKDGDFGNIGNYGNWWSASEIHASSAWYRYLNFHTEDFFRGYYNKDHGFSVRCLQD
jgi:uncharacterized protein (TIGR02145 family)